jgi:7,8-dihydropterin-6-yl-methyl-4-(beta-D-ribofuranosyl)aminobenzene 5'-phosphate synthase
VPDRRKIAFRKGYQRVSVHLTTLSENTAGKPGFASEWGLSILVKTDAATILFDTGASSVAVGNADKLNVDLKAVDLVVLSHGHTDHTGGLLAVLERIGKADVIAHPSVFELKYTKRPYEAHHAFIGMPFKRQLLERHGAHFILSSEPYRIRENIWTSGEIPMVTDFESIEPIFFVKAGDDYVPDAIPDDLALFINTPDGLVIVLGCAHRGLINTIHHARNVTGQQRIHSIVGGTHLFPKTAEQQTKTIQVLESIGVEKIGVSHCTGFEASRMLAEAFGDRFFLNNAGTTI